MKRALLVPLLLSLLLLTACQPEGAAWQAVQARGVLRVGIDPTYPPFALANGDGTYSGLDIELAQLLAEEFGVEVQFVAFGYDGLYDALTAEQVDVLISALVIMPERTRDFAYSEPYFNAGEILIVPVGEREITGMADLDGRTLAVELGALGHVEAITWEKQLSALTVQPYAAVAEALAAVVDGEADAALVDAVSGRTFAAEQPLVQRVTPPVTVEPYAVVLRAEDAVLRQEVDRVLARLVADGRLPQLIQQALGE